MQIGKYLENINQYNLFIRHLQIPVQESQSRKTLGDKCAPIGALKCNFSPIKEFMTQINTLVSNPRKCRLPL